MTAVADPLVRTRSGTRALLLAGVCAGPFFVVSSLAQVLTRDGFDLRRHALSQLELGRLGWLQTATFVLTGLGVIALAAGWRRTVATGPLPVLLGIFGAGLAVAGLALPDAENGFPAGAPDARVPEMSGHAVVHATAAVLAFTALAGACVTHTVRSIRRRATAPAVLSGLVAVVLLLPAPAAHASVQLALTGLISFAWTTALALSALATRTDR
ncbi:hypothetical protein GCM10010168_49440 [Actinoplanes ianthinogenes]|uniref:DUF998 domain-containing protein n=1 Tax=Actinoplanes ianthinogenes TaxID=122358 RepID=A0ABM7M3B2_9ACTN|nr:DUF998 domain-containing protein [Actinoplanes ianthinogenes]BCJ45996.1 hypothetical protein Aiant_66530 [Actinoplanes ianthinogenes]GGR25574.1 hypothetical protein GCM10010168_49440 [Actinoplanes ianthinogenes]